MFTPHEPPPRARDIGRIPFPRLTPWAGPAANGASQLSTPLPLHISTPVTPGQPALGGEQENSVIMISWCFTNILAILLVLHCKAACLACELMHPPDAAGTGNRSAQQGAQPQAMTPLMLWPSKTPGQVPQQQKESSPTLASLPRPSTSLKNSRGGELPSCEHSVSEPCWRTQIKLSCHKPVSVLSACHSLTCFYVCADEQHRGLRQGTAAQRQDREIWSPGLPKIAQADPALVNLPARSASNQAASSSAAPAGEGPAQYECG